MATVESLRRQVAAIRKQMDKQHAPREWCFMLEEGEEIPKALEAKIGEDDTVYIRQYPKGLLGMGRQGDYSIGYVTGPGGTLIIKPDGSLERVRQDSTRPRRRR